MFSKKSVVVGWACSYIIILIIPILAIFINYYFNVRVIEDEIVRANEQVLENLQECVDDFLEDEMTFYEHIFLSETINDMIKKKKVDQSFYYGAYEFINDMENYRKYNPDILCFIYFEEKDYALDLKGGGRSEDLYDSMEYSRRFKEIPYENWKQTIGEYYNNQFIVTDEIYRDTSEECLVYADTIELYKYSKASVFVGIPVSKIEGLLQEGSGKFILSADGQDILCISEADEQHVCLEKESSVPNITYKLLINSKEFWEEAQHTRNILFVSIAVAMVLGGVCAAFLLQRNLQPMSEFLKRIGGEKGKGNEYVQMEAVYKNLMEKNAFMHNKILGQSELIEKNKLLALLKGRVVGGNEEKQSFMPQENEEVALVGFKVPLPDQKLMEHDELLFFVIDNIFVELMNGDKLCKIEDGQYIFYLFAVDALEKEAWKKRCIVKAEYLCNFIEDKWGIHLIATVSGMYAQRVEEVKFLYKDIMEAFEYQELTGGNYVVDTGEIMAGSTDIDFSAMLEMALQKETAEEMHEAVKQVLADLKGRPTHAWQMRGLEVFQQVAKNVYEYNTEEEKVKELFVYLEKLLVATDKKSVHRVLDEILEYGYTSMHKEEEASQNGIVDSVKKYVEQNYADSELNIKAMAANLGWNPKYISRVFREQEGMGILDYINNVRIDKALLLLLNGNYSIEEVSEKVGYASSKTFRRAFAQKMGVAPSKYKKE